MSQPPSTPLVAVDIGNSASHFGLAPDPSGPGPPDLTSVLGLATPDIVSQPLADFLPPQPLRWLVASVCRPAERRLRAWIRSHRPEDCYRLLNHRDLPLTVQVDHPERVGMDRLAAAAAAIRLAPPGRPVIVLDAGTAITVDLVGPRGDFQGGVILPGFQMTARALAADADLLPRIRFSPCDQPPPVVGTSTEAAIRSGLFWGAVGAVRELVRRMASQLPEQPALFVTGGDAQRVTDQLGASAQFVPNLVLMGVALAALSRPETEPEMGNASPPAN